MPNRAVDTDTLQALLRALSRAGHCERWTFRMSRPAMLCCCILFLTSCAGVLQPREIPTSWAQTTDEAGKLPVGRVISVEQVSYLQQGERHPFLGIVPTLIAEVSWFYRLVIRIDHNGTLVERDEFVAYPVGECVALRSEPRMVVPALRGQCD